jgi:multidrug efflux pump subunit AcrB
MAIVFLASIPLAYVVYANLNRNFYKTANADYIFIKMRKSNVLPSSHQYALKQIAPVTHVLKTSLKPLGVTSITVVSGSMTAFRLARTSTIGSVKGNFDYLVRLNHKVPFSQVEQYVGAFKRDLLHTSTAYFVRNFSSSAGLGLSKGAIEVYVPCDNVTDYVSFARIVSNTLAGIKGVDVRSSAGFANSMELDFDKKRLKHAGITRAAMQSTLSSFLHGRVISYLHDDYMTIPFYLRLSKVKRNDINSLLGNRIFSSKLGRSFPLHYFVHPKMATQPVNMTQLDGHLAYIFLLKSSDLSSSAIMRKVNAAFKRAYPKRHIVASDIGAVKQASQVNHALYSSTWICIAMIVILLFYAFHSWVRFLATVLVLPVSILGGFLALLLTGEPFGFLPAVGLVALFGIVINNAIYLISSIDIQRKHYGLSVHDAVIQSVDEKIKPILISSLTTIVALIPLFFITGDFWRGILSMLIGGIFFGLISMLYIVPVMYVLFIKDDSPITL